MKKRTITLVIVLTLLVSLLTVATVAASSSNVGYENFKESMSRIEHSDSGSGQVKVTMTDNDVLQLEATIDMVGDKESNQFYGDVALATINQSKNFQISGNEASVYLIDVTDEKYYTWAMDSDEAGHKGHKQMEDKDDYKGSSAHSEMMDFVIGDLKDNFTTTTENDGSQRLQFNMTKEDVPTSLSFLMNLAAKNHEVAKEEMSDEAMDMKEMDLPFLKGFDFKEQFANTLVSDIQILSLDVEILVNENHQVTEFNFLMSVEGLDEEGTYHKVDLSVAASMDNTLVEEIKGFETNQYDWEVLSMEHSKSHHRIEKN